MAVHSLPPSSAPLPSTTTTTSPLCLTCCTPIALPSRPPPLLHSCCGRHVCNACIASNVRLASFCPFCEDASSALRKGPRSDTTRSGKVLWDAERELRRLDDDVKVVGELEGPQTSGGEAEDDFVIADNEEEQGSGEVRVSPRTSSPVNSHPPGRLLSDSRLTSATTTTATSPAQGVVAATSDLGASVEDSFSLVSETFTSDSALAATAAASRGGQAPSIRSLNAAPRSEALERLREAARPRSATGGTGAVIGGSSTSKPKGEGSFISSSIVKPTGASSASSRSSSAPIVNGRDGATAAEGGAGDGHGAADDDGDDDKGTQMYWLRPDDTLMGLSLRFNVPTRTLCVLNDLPMSGSSGLSGGVSQMMHTRPFLLVPSSAIRKALASRGDKGFKDLEASLKGPPRVPREERIKALRREAEARFRAAVLRNATSVRLARAKTFSSPDEGGEKRSGGRGKEEGEKEGVGSGAKWWSGLMSSLDVALTSASSSSSSSASADEARGKETTPCDARAARAYVACVEEELSATGDWMHDGADETDDEEEEEEGDGSGHSSTRRIVRDLEMRERFDAVLKLAVARWEMDSEWERRKRREGFSHEGIARRTPLFIKVGGSSTKA